LNNDSGRILVFVFVSIRSYVRCKSRWGDSKKKTYNWGSESYADDFFSDAKLISLQALQPGARFTQEYFINTILPDIVHCRG
jgi:hypothetical protein